MEEIGRLLIFCDEVKRIKPLLVDEVERYKNRMVEIIKENVPEVEKVIGRENMNPQGFIAYAYGLPKPIKEEPTKRAEADAAKPVIKRFEGLPAWQKAGLAVGGVAALAGVVYAVRKWYRKRKESQAVRKIQALQQQVAQRALTHQQFQAEREQVLAPFSLEDKRKIEEKIVPEHQAATPAWGG